MYTIGTTVKVVTYSKSKIVGKVGIVIEDDEKYVVVDIDGATYLFLPGEVEAL